jgi:hypothetical protein
MIGSHVHIWASDRCCRLHFTIGGRVTRCHARKCAAPGCESKAATPLDYCETHRALARRLTIAQPEGRP